MKFYAIDRLSGLKKGAYGIFEPDEKNEETTADLILVPGVVFSESGDRIGQAIFTPYLVADNDTANGERNGGFGSTN